MEVSKNNITINITIEELKDIISTTVKEHTVALISEIKDLKQQINVLKESNIDMIRLYSSNSTIHNTYDQNFIDNLNETNLSADTIVENESTTIKKKSDKKEYKNKFTERSAGNRIALAKKIVIGTGGNEEDIQSDNIADEENFASKRRLWIYVGRCKPTSTPDDIKNYLKRRIPDHGFTITKLDSQGRNLSYKVETDMELENQLYTPSFWPKGVIVKRFQFRNKRFQAREF